MIITGTKSQQQTPGNMARYTSTQDKTQHDGVPAARETAAEVGIESQQLETIAAELRPE